MKRFLRLAVLALILGTAAHAFAQAPAQTPPQVTAIRAGKLVVPETGQTLTNQIILVEGARIKAVGANVQIPAGAKVIDLSRQTVMPGLFACHEHMAFLIGGPRSRERGSLFFYDLTHTNAERAIHAVVNSRDMLDSGFTTIRDIGNDANYVSTDLRRAIDQGLIPGPTIINSGRIIAPFGGQYQLQPERRHLGEPEYFYADTRDEMRKAIRENVHFGARVIKIVVDDQPYIYSADEIRYMVAEAATAGVKLAAHCVTEQGARNAAEAGVASIEHGFEMSDEVLAIAKKNNVVLVGTDFTEKAWMAYQMPAELAKQLHARSVDRLRRAYKIGVTMAFGSDLIFYAPDETRGTWTMSQIESLVEANIPPKEIVRMMTTNAARLLGVERARGAIAPGQFADIIATPENPLENIQTLKQVNFVMKNGKVFKGAK
ncbi:MAG TPA: amidohydrolase family protein [Pyrinomonadaceae bacterium]|nr:amidohydrolase family protein [Pyrinomonadaceae bacterium]